MVVRPPRFCSRTLPGQLGGNAPTKTGIRLTGPAHEARAAWPATGSAETAHGACGAVTSSAPAIDAGLAILAAATTATTVLVVGLSSEALLLAVLPTDPEATLAFAAVVPAAGVVAAAIVGVSAALVATHLRAGGFHRSCRHGHLDRSQTKETANNVSSRWLSREHSG